MSKREEICPPSKRGHSWVPVVLNPGEVITRQDPAARICKRCMQTGRISLVTGLVVPDAR